MEIFIFLLLDMEAVGLIQRDYDLLGLYPPND